MAKKIRFYHFYYMVLVAYKPHSLIAPISVIDWIMGSNKMACKLQFFIGWQEEGVNYTRESSKKDKRMSLKRTAMEVRRQKHKVIVETS
jgi:hypothetical protein